LLVIELSFVFAVSRFRWPEKPVAVFAVLGLPWPATYKLVRANAWGALLLALFLLAAVVAKLHL